VGPAEGMASSPAEAGTPSGQQCISPPDQNQNRNGDGHKGGHKNGKGPRPQQPHPPQRGAARGFSVGSMGSTLTITPINALRRSRRSWSGKLRRRRRQRAWL
jgi:hypothetical protein